MADQDNEGAPLLVKQAAAYLRVSPNTLYKWTSKGLVPFYKPNGRILYFRREELDAWVNRNRNVPDYEMAEQAQARIGRDNQVPLPTKKGRG